MNVRNGLIGMGLALFLVLSGSLRAQVTEAEAHILSAFTTGADSRVLADNVKIGPTLRAEVGADPAKAYDAIIDRVAGKMLRVRLLTPAEAARYASMPGVTVGEPIVVLETGDLQLLFQYAAKEKHVAFVEQISAPVARTAPPPVRIEGPQPPAEAPKPAVEVAPAPPPVEAPKPPPVATPAPTIAPAPIAPASPVAKPAPAPAAPRAPAAAAAAQPVKPRPASRPTGECVVKPVMSEQDLVNCAAPSAAAVQKPAAAAAVAPAAPPAPAPAPAPAARSAPRGECVIKPVMSEEDLRNCAAVSSRGVPPPAAPTQPVATQKPAAAAAAAPAPRPRGECVIKPVMSDEDLRNCAAVSKSSTPAPAAAAALPVAAPAAPAPVTPKPRPECVIKPVMTEEDLRNCAAASSSSPRAATPAPAAVQTPASAAPAAPAPKARTECVIKPVMTEEDLRACGVRR